MALIQILKKNWRSDNKVSTLRLSAGNKLIIKEREWKCKYCSGVLTEQSICLECKKPVDMVCLFCEKVTMFDEHEFCYCQLELLVPKTGGKTNCQC